MTAADTSRTPGAADGRDRPGDPGGRAPTPPGSRARTRLAAVLLLSALGAGLVVVAVVAAGIGAYPIPAEQVAASILHALGLEVGTPPDRIGHRSEEHTSELQSQ